MIVDNNQTSGVTGGRLIALITLIDASKRNTHIFRLKLPILILAM